MTRFTILLTSVLFTCCTDLKKSNQVTEVADKTKEINSSLEKSNKVSKLERLKVWVDSTRILKLPFRANFDTTTDNTFRVKFWETDSIFRKDFKRVGDIYLMGLLSDTINFYGFVFVSNAAVGNLGLITFDKLGNKIDLKLLTKENCVIYAGDILLCKEYTIIRQDWSLNYYFKSIVAGAGSSTDTICSHSVSKGRINKMGEIDVGQITELNCEK